MEKFNEKRVKCLGRGYDPYAFLLKATTIEQMQSVSVFESNGLQPSCSNKTFKVINFSNTTTAANTQTVESSWWISKPIIVR